MNGQSAELNPTPTVSLGDVDQLYKLRQRRNALDEEIEALLQKMRGALTVGEPPRVAGKYRVWVTRGTPRLNELKLAADYGPAVELTKVVYDYKRVKQALGDLFSEYAAPGTPAVRVELNHRASTEPVKRMNK